MWLQFFGTEPVVLLCWGLVLALVTRLFPLTFQPILRWSRYPALFPAPASSAKPATLSGVQALAAVSWQSRLVTLQGWSFSLNPQHPKADAPYSPVRAAKFSSQAGPPEGKVKAWTPRQACVKSRQGSPFWAGDEACKGLPFVGRMAESGSHRTLPRGRCCLLCS